MSIPANSASLSALCRAENFDPRFPIIIGGLLNEEQRFGYVTIRIKRHRWFTKTLKTNDPLIFSLGWRRFQSMPIYHLENGRRGGRSASIGIASTRGRR
jgi:hypothetical protein